MAGRASLLRRVGAHARQHLLISRSFATRRPVRSSFCAVVGVAGAVATGMLTASFALTEAKKSKKDSLFHAVSIGDLQAVETIMEALPDIEKQKAICGRHPGGWTCAHLAAANNNEKLLRYILEHGGDIDTEDTYKCTRNTPESRIEERKQFNRYINPRVSCVGWTPLHYATAFGHVECVALLLELGADPTKKDDKGYTAEHYISYSRDQPRTHEMLGAVFAHVKEHGSTMAASEARKKATRIKFPLEEKLRSTMVGQVFPILTVSAAMRRRDNGWVDDNKPLVFLFLGSSGVGKTMLAKSIAESTVQSRSPSDAFIRLDMSEYSHKHEVARLIGSPPGYIGHDQGGQLTTKLANCPDAVVLLDEVEKAHPDVLTLMLQVFDEGRLTDGQGQTINCPNAVFIMTSNLLQDQIRAHSENGLLRPPRDEQQQALSTTSLQSPTMLNVNEQTETFLRDVAQPVLKYHFKRDEFLGRINEMIVFHPFSNDDLGDIVRMELQHWAGKARERHSMNIKWSPTVAEHLQSGYNERYGFRSIKYAVQRRVVNLLAFAHERDIIRDGCDLLLDTEDSVKEGGELSDKKRIIIKDVVNREIVEEKKEDTTLWSKLFR